VSALARSLGALCLMLAFAAQAAEPATPPAVSQKGSLDFDLFAMSQEGAECAAKPEVEKYLQRELIPAFLNKWAEQGHTIDYPDFTVDFQFELDADGRVSHSAIRTATPKPAGTDVHDCFKAATPVPLPEPTRCLVGQTYGYRIRHAAQTRGK
jgi:hypothetical protein